MNRSPLKIAVAAACAVALMLPLAGCGGDDKDEKATAPAPTSTGTPLPPEIASFVTEAEKICAQTRSEIQALQNDITPTPSTEQISALLVQFSDLFIEEVNQLKSLDVPDPIASKVTGWLASVTKAAEETATLTEESIKKRNEAGKESIFADADNRAADIGVNGCRTDFVAE